MRILSTGELREGEPVESILVSGSRRGIMRYLANLLRQWWIFRDVVATDVDYAAVGDKSFLLISTTKKFKGVIEVEINRDEFIDLMDTLIKEDFL